MRGPQLHCGPHLFFILNANLKKNGHITFSALRSLQNYCYNILTLL